MALTDIELEGQRAARYDAVRYTFMMYAGSRLAKPDGWSTPMTRQYARDYEVQTVK